MMFSVSQQDILKRLRHAGIAAPVQASQALQAFQYYVQSELPEVTPDDCTPLFVRDGVLVVKSFNPALMQTLRNREAEITTYIYQATGQRIHRLQFRAS